MLATVIVLYCAAFALPAFGAIKLWLQARHNYETAISNYAECLRIEKNGARRYRAIEASFNAGEITRNEHNAEKEKARQETVASLGELGLVRSTRVSLDGIEYRLPAIVMRALANGQRWNVLLIVAGLILSTTAGVLSLFAS